MKLKVTTEKIILFGDYHGSYHTFYRNMLRLHIMGVLDLQKFIVNKEYYVIFLGDIVDRGQHSLEILEILFKFICNSDGRMILNRGNHEKLSQNRYDGLEKEINNKFISPNAEHDIAIDNYYDETLDEEGKSLHDGTYNITNNKILKNINMIFSLCSSAIILKHNNKKIWLCHGLIPIIDNDDDRKEMSELINYIKDDKQTDFFKLSIRFSTFIRWNDTPLGESNIPSRGTVDGSMFKVGLGNIRTFLQATQINFIIRGHEDNYANSWLAIKPTKKLSPRFIKHPAYNDNSNRYDLTYYDDLENKKVFSEFFVKKTLIIHGENNAESINQVNGPVQKLLIPDTANCDKLILPILTISNNTDNDRFLSSDSFICINNGNSLPTVYSKSLVNIEKSIRLYIHGMPKFFSDTDKIKGLREQIQQLTNTNEIKNEKLEKLLLKNKCTTFTTKATNFQELLEQTCHIGLYYDYNDLIKIGGNFYIDNEDENIKIDSKDNKLVPKDINLDSKDINLDPFNKIITEYKEYFNPQLTLNEIIKLMETTPIKKTPITLELSNTRKYSLILVEYDIIKKEYNILKSIDIK